MQSALRADVQSLEVSDSTLSQIDQGGRNGYRVRSMTLEPKKKAPALREFDGIETVDAHIPLSPIDLFEMLPGVVLLDATIGGEVVRRVVTDRGVNPLTENREIIIGLSKYDGTSVLSYAPTDDSVHIERLREFQGDEIDAEYEMLRVIGTALTERAFSIVPKGA